MPSRIAHRLTSVLISLSLVFDISKPTTGCPLPSHAVSMPCQALAARSHWPRLDPPPGGYRNREEAAVLQQQDFALGVQVHNAATDWNRLEQLLIFVLQTTAKPLPPPWDFVEHHLIPFIRKRAANQIRIAYAIGARTGSGKTTHFAQTVRRLKPEFPRRWVRAVYFDDFLIDRRKRKPHPDTLEFEGRNDLTGYLAFMEGRAQNQRVVKPIADQTAKAPLGFITNLEGEIVLTYSDIYGRYAVPGNRWLIIHLDNDQKTFGYNELRKHDPQEPLPPDSKYVDNQRGIIRVLPHSQSRQVTSIASDLLRIGESDFEVSRDPTDGSLRVTLLGWDGEPRAFYQFRTKESQRWVDTYSPRVEVRQGQLHVVRGDLYNSQVLSVSPDSPTDALEIFDPITPDPEAGYEGDIDVAEGLGAYMTPYIDISSNNHLGFEERRSRILHRDMGSRGQPVGTTLDRRDQLYWRLYSEERAIAQANLEADRQRGPDAAEQTHFQINARTLVESLYHLLKYESATSTHKDVLATIGLDYSKVEAVVAVMRDMRLQSIIAAAEYFTKDHLFRAPRAFPGDDPDLSVPASSLGNWRVIGISKLLSMHLQWSALWKRGYLDKPMIEKLQKIMARSRNTHVGAQIFKVDPQQFGWNREPQRPPRTSLGEETWQVDRLDEAVVSDPVPLLGSRLSNLAQQIATLEEAGHHEKATERKLEGETWIRAFFDLYETMLKLGMVHTRPDMMRLYGFVMPHGYEALACTDFGSIELDEEAAHTYATIAFIENFEPDYAVPTAQAPAYTRSEVYRGLQGFQRRFLWNHETREDYYSAIPEVFKPFYVAQVRERVIPEASDLKFDGLFHKDRNSFRNLGPRAEDLDVLALSALAAKIWQTKMDHLEQSLVKNVLPSFDVSLVPALAWLKLCLATLDPEAEKLHYRLLASFYNDVLRDGAILDRLVVTPNLAEALVDLFQKMLRGVGLTLEAALLTDTTNLVDVLGHAVKIHAMWPTHKAFMRWRESA